MRALFNIKLTLHQIPARGLRRLKMASMASVASVEASTKETNYHHSRPRKFAPLSLDRTKDVSGLPKLKGVIFDVDGTLCLPQNYMFKQMREALGIPKSVDILDHIRSLSNEPDKQTLGNNASSHPSDQASSDEIDKIATPSRAGSSPRSRAIEAIQSIERTAMTEQTPQPGLVEVMTYLDSRRIPKGLCTRNFPGPVQHLIDEFLAPHGVKFVEQEIITRDAKGVQPKPSPEGLWSIARHWSLQHGLTMGESGKENLDTADEQDVLTVAKKHLGSGLIMVGDSIDDMAAGYRAGAATILLVNDDNKDLANHEYTDLAINRLDELVEILENGFVGNSTP